MYSLCFLYVPAVDFGYEPTLVFRDLAAHRVAVDGTDRLLDGGAGDGVGAATTVQLRNRLADLLGRRLALVLFDYFAPGDMSRRIQFF